MSDPDSIPPALSEYIAGLESHDVVRIASTFGDDVVFVTPARTMVRDEILEFLSARYIGDFPTGRMSTMSRCFATTEPLESSGGRAARTRDGWSFPGSKGLIRRESQY